MIFRVLFCICRTECEAQVKGFAGSIYKKFNTTDEANDFIKQKQPKSTVSVRTDSFASGTVSFGPRLGMPSSSSTSSSLVSQYFLRLAM